mgnify:FL=1
MARYDGIRFGYRETNTKSAEECITLSRSRGFGKEVKRKIMTGTYLLSNSERKQIYIKAQKTRRMIFEKTKEIFREFDVILSPVSPGTAFSFNQRKDPLAMYLEDVFTVHANLTGMPAISLPVGKHSNNMPFGLQLMADQFQERKLLTISDYLCRNAEK